MLRELKRAPWWAKGLLGVIALFVVLAIVGAVAGSGGDEDAETTSASTQRSPAPADTVRPAATVAPATVGLPSNQAQVGNLLLTVNGVAPYADEVFPAEAGTHYVAVDITAKNTGDKTYVLNRFNFHLKDSDKFTGEGALTSGPDPGIGSHDMVPGQEVRGFLVFKIGDARTPVELQYQSFTGSAATIALR